MKQLTFKELRQLLLILIGGVVITVFIHHYFHHDRYEHIGSPSSRIMIDKMTGNLTRVKLNIE